MSAHQHVDPERALGHLMDFLALPGLSGEEGPVAEEIRNRLLSFGVAKSAIRHDDAHRKIGRSFEIGNLIVKIPGTRGRNREPRRLFMGHMDKVPLCRGAVPVRENGRIVSKGDTALGGDNRTAIAAIVTLVETLRQHDLPHPPLTLAFTVGEEIGLLGARHLELDRLGDPEMGFNIDGGDPANITVGAIGADRWEVDVYGRSSHAGVHPEHGISAALIASRAITAVAEKGYFGKIEVGKNTGTANVGVIRGGEATNQVTDHVYLYGESRSHSAPFLERITNTWRRELERAAKATRNSRGEHGRIDFRAERDYESFKMSKREPCLRLVHDAAQRVGLEAKLKIANGGLDANYLNAKGLPTVTLGAGQHDPHTVDESVEISEYLDGCRLLVEIAAA